MSDVLSPIGALTSRLASLLGFEDGASDVLEHLLSIESEEDLLDYISQLLGDDGKHIRTFVDDVGRYHRGECLSNAAILERKETEKKEVKLPEQSYEPTQKEPMRPNEKKRQPESNNKSGIQTRTGKAVSQQKKDKEVSAKSESGKGKIHQVVSKDAVMPKSAALSKEQPSIITAVKDTPKKRKPPARGKADINCGCFGTKHKSLSNCLYCGRILCEREGYGFCPCCGFQVEEINMIPGEGQDEAWLHKERLLQFDRDFARRTVILDDQADYFANQSSSWLSTDERQDSKGKDDERRKHLHQRKKAQLNIAF